jgi:hypothetical protein
MRRIASAAAEKKCPAFRAPTTSAEVRLGMAPAQFSLPSGVHGVFLDTTADHVHVRPRGTQIFTIDPDRRGRRALTSDRERSGPHPISRTRGRRVLATADAARFIQGCAKELGPR